jgi:hypothetical protein
VETGVSADFTKMEKEKEQYRSVIRFLFLEGKSRSEIKERLDAVYGDSSPSMATVKNGFNRYVHSNTNISIIEEHLHHLNSSFCLKLKTGPNENPNLISSLTITHRKKCRTTLKCREQTSRSRY